MARSFCIGEPGNEVRDLTARAARSMELIRSILRPALPVRDFNRAVLEYFKEQGLWQRRGWIGGYEMGIAFPPDWVGHFVFDPAADPDTDRIFEPGTAVNYENQFFMPGHRGQYFTIDSFLFEDERVHMLSEQPFDLMVVE
jgi:Xaa-Pro aminopeptidase